MQTFILNTTKKKKKSNLAIHHFTITLKNSVSGPFLFEYFGWCCREAFQFNILSFSKLIFLLYYQRIFRTFHFEKGTKKKNEPKGVQYETCKNQEWQN